MLLVLATLLLSNGCHHATDPSTNRYLTADTPFWATGSGGIAVTEEPNATRVAVEILRAGGNAVDAAVAAALALAVTFPEAGNLGGGGFMVVYDPSEREFWALDFRETAPSAAYRDMYLDLAAAGEPDATELGPLASGIPGTPAGLYAAWKRSGSMKWPELVTPAIELAIDGFAVSERLAESFAGNWSELRRFYSTRRVFSRRGERPRAGHRLVQRELRVSLGLIALRGADTFYRGKLARQLVDGVRDAGGNWTRGDLAGYRAVFRAPGRVPLTRTSPAQDGSLQDSRIEIVTMSPPSSGTLTFGQALSFLTFQNAFDHKRDDPQRAVALIEALRLAFVDRNTQLADPERMTRTVEELLSAPYLRQRAGLLPAAPPGDSRKIPGGHPGGGSGNTTHLVVMDDRGGVVSLTTTVNALFGSKFVVPGTGIFLNNEMDDFDTRPGLPNRYGLVGSGVNAVAPGARMLSSMSPTIVVKDGEPWIALGSRGGPRILSTILQVVLNRCYDGMGLADAVEAPRIHHQWWPDEVLFEEAHELPTLRAELETIGYRTRTRDVIGRVIAAERLEDGRFMGVRDPRISGLAMPVSSDDED
jgi:gamma-glutamyltranspeptidase/glutathione hydrolase